jgi:hypothetical protein
MFFCPILGLFSLRSQCLTTFFVRFNHLPQSTMNIPTQDQIDKWQQLEDELYRDPRNQRNDHEPDDSQRQQMLRGDRQPD